MIMHNPPHVGEILWEVYLEPLGISVTDAAKNLGVTRQSLSRLINKKIGISADMAIRLGEAFENSPEFWLGLEKQYELWQAVKKHKKSKIKPMASLCEALQAS